MKIKNIGVSGLCIMLLSVCFLTSCKKYHNPEPIFEDLVDQTSLQRKTLMISIDGLSGKELEKLAPKNIMSLKEYGKYSYETSVVNTGAAGWVSMLTGTSLAKHRVKDDNFERMQDSDSEDHAEVKSYRNVLDYTTEFKSFKTALVTPWANLRSYLKNADYAPIVNDDVEVKDSTVRLLGENRSLGTLIVNFKSVEQAGKEGGYTLSNANYDAAAQQVDEYVGEIMDALRGRENYEKEDWLVIITASHGGDSEYPVNGFVIVSNPAFKKYKIERTGFNPVFYNSKTSRAVLEKDPDGLFDVGDQKSFTVQMDVMFNAIPGGYSSFFGKSTNLSGQSITGWQWAYYPGGKWVVTVGGTLNGGSGKQEFGSADAPGNSVWRTLTMTVNYENSSTRTLTMYMDGVKQNSGNISARKSLNISEMLRVGHRVGDNDVVTPFYSGNLAYFNTALTEQVVKDTYGLTDISKHPNYANLVGFWPMDEGAESTYLNKIDSRYNLTLSGAYSWESLGELYPASTLFVPATSTLSITSTASDVATLILYWNDIEILKDYDMDGRPYLQHFELEFLKD